MLISFLLHGSIANKFEPYVLHGGLVSAIAGKDYVVVASDTRLSDGGYNILSRDHLQSRLWSTSGHFAINSSLFRADGSISVRPISRPSDTWNEEEEYDRRTEVFTDCPTIIASSGCSSDCEALKRQFRGELNTFENWCYGKDTLTASGIANLLGQTLYARRTFPFYSFCILAGLEKTGHAHVHTYDAIGSHERVAVGCAGNGKEMLQPILDRMFSCSVESEDAGMSKDQDSGIIRTEVQRDGRAVEASKQRIGLKLEPPVETYVMCDSKTAVGLLIRAYRSVAEREISVGDSVVICVIRRKQDTQNGQDVCFEVEVVHSKLKQH